ncbi:MAG: hypothetical protein AAF394_19120, partial [Planctomycetota bacterium]
LLFAVWLLRETPVLPPQSVNFQSSQGSAGATSAAEPERTILPPGLEVLNELEEPQLEQELSQISESAKLVAAQLEVSTAIYPVRGKAGDKRLAGPAGDGDGDGEQKDVGVWARWELKFKAADIRSYAKQLDYFEIELGCVGGGITTVDSASDFSSGGKKTSQSPAEANRSDKLIFAWRDKNELAKYDHRLLSQAGIQTEARTLLRFIPAKLEAELMKLELEYCQQNKQTMEKVYKTVFECRPQGNDFEWVVAAQLYRK